MAAQILVVEDNPTNMRLVSCLLEAAGHRVIPATNVQEARAALASSTPDLALLDVNVPGGGGEAVLHELRSTERLARVPAIAVTALAMTGDRERLLAAGFDDYVPKPIDTRAFVALVASYVSKRATT
jgi:two-component system cell cycle response regulator